MPVDHSPEHEDDVALEELDVGHLHKETNSAAQQSLDTNVYV